FQNRRAWRMGFQIKLQKFQENFGIEHGDREFDSASEGGVSRFEFQVSSCGWEASFGSGGPCCLCIVILSEAKDLCILLIMNIGIWIYITANHVFHKMKAIVEMQLQAQFLGGESAGSQAGAKLIEHVRQ